jgi:predicted nucleic acid-binding protein
MRFLDTDVVVDLLREHEPALDWFDRLEEDPAVPGYVLLELMEGCRNLREMKNLRVRTASFQVYWPNEEDLDHLLAIYPEAYLSHHLDVIDGLNAACALGHGAVLCTFNQKHFKAIPNLKTEQPYERKKQGDESG